MKPHIRVLLDAEKETDYKCGGHIHFDRINGHTISISCEGYQHCSLNEVESKLLKLGCRYDFKRGVQEFDKVCGRTFTYMTEPAWEKI